MTGTRPDPAGEPPRRPWPASYLGRAWRGEARFWPFYYVFGVFGFVPILLLAQDVLPEIHDSGAMDLAGLAFFAGYTTWCGIVMWRCAANVRGLSVYLAPLLAFFHVSGGVLVFLVTALLGLWMLGIPLGLERSN